MSAPLSMGDLDESQLEALDERLSKRGLGGIQGPPGTGKSGLMALEASISYALGDGPIVVAAFGNLTVDNVFRLTMAQLRTGLITRIDGDLRDHICRVGYPQGISADIMPFHTNRPQEIKKRGIIFTTLHSAYRIANRVRAGRVIIDETAQARPEQAYIVLEHAATTIANWQETGLALTVVGDHMQSRPISPGRYETGILLRLTGALPHQVAMLRTTYREPEPVVDMTSQTFYEGRLDAPDEVRERRLPLPNPPHGWLRDVLDSEEPLTLVDTRSLEVQDGFGFSNPAQAAIVRELTAAYSASGIDVRNHDRFMIMSTYRAQLIETRRELEGAGYHGVRATSVTKALGSEADVAIFQTVRSNRGGNLGMTGWNEILNVGTSRMRCKLIVIGNLETLSHGQVYEPDRKASYLSRSRSLSRFIEQHGRVVEAPLIQT